MALPYCGGGVMEPTRALIEVVASRDPDLAASGFCPGCGRPWRLPLPDWLPLPASRPAICVHCRAEICITVTSPEPEPPPPASPERSRLERAWQKRPADPLREVRKLTPCPRSAPRHRLTHWQQLGKVPADLNPATLAKGYRLAFDQEPRRDRQKPGIRAYSGREVGLALQALAIAGEVLR
jgi:hypothetical protein